MNLKATYYAALLIWVTCLLTLLKTHAQILTASFVNQEGVTTPELKYLIAKEKIQLQYFDTLQLKQAQWRTLVKLQADGYLAASISDSKRNDSTYIVTVTSGAKYKWAGLRFQPDKEYLYRMLGIATYMQRAFTPAQLSQLHYKVLRYYENNGYPFAQVYLDSVVIKDDKIFAAYIIQTGNKVVVDSMSIEGNAKISKAILYNYLSIKPGDIYNESLMQSINTRIREISYVSATKPAQVLFSTTGCYVKLFLAEKKSSQIDGIIGVMPAANADDKPIITGDIRLRLQNSFAHGELFDLHWERPKNLTQVLNVKCIYPFLFKTPFGIDAALNIRKQDTTFLNVQGNFGVNYFLTGGNYIKFYVQTLNSSLLSTANLKGLTTLPVYADISKQAGGIGIRKEDVDYRYNPRKGYTIEFVANAGIRTIKPNPNINEQLYDSVDLKTTQYESTLHCNTYFPLGKHHVINVGIQAGGIFSDLIFENEVFRIGGLQSLRGFDEQSILASQYAIGKFEYRFILDAGSYLQAFFNTAYIRQTINSTITDTPYGFGAGISFETRLGFFSFNYALGKQFDNPIYVRAAKIHFGIINYF